MGSYPLSHDCPSNHHRPHREYLSRSPARHFRLVSLLVFLSHFVVRCLFPIRHRLPNFPASATDFPDADRVHRVFTLVLLATMLREEDEGRPSALRPVDVAHHDSFFGAREVAVREESSYETMSLIKIHEDCT